MDEKVQISAHPQSTNFEIQVSRIPQTPQIPHTLGYDALQHLDDQQLTFHHGAYVRLTDCHIPALKPSKVPAKPIRL